MAPYSHFAWLIAQAAPVVEAADKAATEAATGDASTGTLRLLIAIGIIIGSFVAGTLIANALRMRDYSFRIGLVLFTLFASIAIVYFGWPPKRGIDLSGGVVLVYEVDTQASSSDWMSNTVQTINQEINAGGGERLVARPLENNRIEIVVPAGGSADAVQNTIESLRESGTILNLESRTIKDGATVLLYRADPGTQRQLDMNKLIAAVGRRINPGGVKELTIRQYGAEQIEVIIPEVDEREVDQIKRKISTSGALIFRMVANPTDNRELIRAAERTPGRDVMIGPRLAGRWVKAGPNALGFPPDKAVYRTTPDGTRQILVSIDPFNVDGQYITRAAAGFDQRGGNAVDFNFDAIGAEKFRSLTSRNLPDESGFTRNLGIILDNEMISAPNLQSTISGQGQITGVDKDEVEVLVSVLNAGSLPASLRPEPISQQRISAQLGDDTIRSGTRAMLISTALILIFMLVYYHFAGFVADIAVVLNVLMTVALMIMVKAAFTLPGLAGLVLTVGMAVDANVLIYERIREELERGASLRMAIRNGFSRATGTILDSNITTLITAIVLYVIGTDQIKGFAVTLILGLLVSMFTAIYVSRVILDIAERKRWIERLTMMKFFGTPKFEYIRYCIPAVLVSSVIVAAGLVAMISRGKELLDIDFTGGSSVQIEFAEGKAQPIADVRKAVAELPDVAVSSVGEAGQEFKIDTSDREIANVQKVLKETFGSSLKTYSMSHGELTKIEAAPAASTTPAGEVPAGESPAAAPATGTPAATATPAEQPAAETPAAEPAPTETPAAEQPAAEPAAEAPAENPAPQPEESSSRSARSPFRFASYLQEEKAAETPPAETPAEPASATPATETPPAQAPAAETPAKQEPATETPAATTSEPAAETQLTAPADLSLVGGTRAELKFPEPIAHDPLAELVQGRLDSLGLGQTPFRLANPSYQEGSDARYDNWALESSLDTEQTGKLLDAMEAELAATPVFASSSEIGGKVAGDTQMMAVYAMLASMVMIVLYVWIRFQNLFFGLAAVVALVHDVLIAVAALALSAYLSPYMGALLVDPFKISLAVVAALLTIVGFSINDTIVIFDRIREVRGKSPRVTADMINLSVNQTLSRTIITSGTVFIACLILYFVGGPGIHAFAYTMVIGVIAGTYSTVYIAAPLLLWLQPAPDQPVSKRDLSTTGHSR